MIKAGTKLNSRICGTQIMTLRVPAGVELTVTCGGEPMTSDAVDAAAGGEGIIAGKRYTDAAETMEFLCTRGGAGPLAVNGETLVVKQAKQLPSSD